MTESRLETAFSFLFRSASDGVFIASNQRIEQVNPAAAAMLGLTVEEILDQNVESLFQQNPALLNLFNRGGDQTLDVRLPKRRLAIGMAATLASGKRMVLLQDVTEKAELESRREALISTMTHDLRNPISALSGYAELVEKFGDLSTQQQKFMTRIRQTAAKLYDVIGSLVDLAWIEAGMPLAHRPIRLDTLIDRAINQLTHTAFGLEITIAFSVQNPLPMIMGDPERLQLVIYNLLHNAIIYSHPQQTVAIHAWSDATEVYCSVADRGIGIADDELELIFDRLYRSRDEQVREIPGGGLGLTMARTIISRHGGDIWASSNLGVGSTFTFVLPTTRG